MIVRYIACASLLLVIAACGHAHISGSSGTQGSQMASVDVVGQGGGIEVEPEAVVEPRIIRGNDRVTAPPKEVPKLTGAPVSFSFEEAPVAEVVRTILGDILKVDYVLHPPMNGAITLSTRQPVSPDQAVFLLESALQANGLAMMRDARGAYQVGRTDALRSLGVPVRQAGNQTTIPPGYGAVIVPLNYIGAQEMAAILRPMIQPDALLRVDPLRNILVMMGNRSQAEAWMELVNTFDVDILQGMSVGVFPLKYTSTAEVEAGLRLIAAGLEAGGAARATAPTGAGTSAPRPVAGVAAASAAQAAAVGASIAGMRIMPIERLNSILVVTPRAARLDEVRRWIERLDQPNANSAEPQLFIYQVQNGSARHLTSVLSGIFGDGRAQVGAPTGNPTSGVAPGLGSATVGGFNSGASLLGSPSGAGGTQGWRTASQSTTNQQGTQAQQPVAASLGSMRVMSDDVNNAILFWGPRSEFAKVEASLRRLDVSPTQVLIEATIIEVTLDDSLQYGLQWFFNDQQRNGLAGSGSLFNGDSTKSGSLVGAAAQGFTYTLRSALGGDLRVVLNALAAKSLLKVISSPSLMVQDNFNATIMVGRQQPVSAGTTISGAGNIVSNNIQYKDTGVNLSVTPSVNAGNMVSMVINQTVTDLGAFDDATQQYSFLQRQITSKVAVRSGEALVLGGLIRDNSTTGNSGIPLLQDIPVLGKLFGATRTGLARTELLVVITPRVVRSDQEIREVSGELRERMRALTAVNGRLLPTAPPGGPLPPVVIEPIR